MPGPRHVLRRQRRSGAPPGRQRHQALVGAAAGLGAGAFGPGQRLGRVLGAQAGQQGGERCLVLGGAGIVGLGPLAVEKRLGSGGLGRAGLHCPLQARASGQQPPQGRQRRLGQTQVARFRPRLPQLRQKTPDPRLSFRRLILAAGKVLQRGVMLGPQRFRRLDGRGLGQDRRVLRQRIALVLEALATLGAVGDPGADVALLGLDLRGQRLVVSRRLGQRGEGFQLRGEPRTPGQQRQGLGDLLEPIQRRLRRVGLPPRRLPGLFRCLGLPRELLQRIGRNLDSAALALQLGQRPFRLDQPAAALAATVEIIEPRAQPLQLRPQPREPGTGRKQHLAQIAAAGEDAVAALFQRLVIEREHRRIPLTREAAQRALQDRLGHWRVVAIQQAAGIALEPLEVQRPARMAERGADLQAGSGMAEIVAGADRDAEQEIEPGREERRFPRFVRPVKDVQIRLARRGRLERQAAVGKAPVTGQVQPVEPHHPSSPAERLDRMRGAPCASNS